MNMDFLAFVYQAYKTLQPEDDNRPSRSQYQLPNTSVNSTGQHSPVATDIHQPTIPRLADIDKPPGYEDVTFEPKTLIPPVHSELGESYARQGIKSFAVVIEEDVRDALIRYAGERCCYSAGTIGDMKINEIDMFSTFHYTLETFTEKREIVWCYEPYGGEAIDSVKNGTAPGPWDIAQTPTDQFKDGKWQTEIPHTASIISCYVCEGIGKEKCIICQGSTQVDCTWCNGRGKRLNDDICTHCTGDGTKRCTECHCTGQSQCCTCIGEGRLKCYIKLITTWTNHKDEFEHRQTPLPPELIQDVTGHVAFQEQQSRVWPVNHFPQHNVKEVSNNLVNNHKRAFPIECILQQRHEVRIVPIAQVKYAWKDNFGKFFVYGFENKVHFPDYPQSCCCGCIII